MNVEFESCTTAQPMLSFFCTGHLQKLNVNLHIVDVKFTITIRNFTFTVCKFYTISKFILAVCKFTFAICKLNCELNYTLVLLYLHCYCQWRAARFCRGAAKSSGQIFYLMGWKAQIRNAILVHFSSLKQNTRKWGDNKYLYN